MELRRFGSTGAAVAAIGQGTWRMELDDRADAIAALRRGLDLGLTHVDTAELYGDGRVEELVAEALAGRRDEVFLASKVLPEHADYAGTIAACERSLRRLRTERLDLYLLHWPGDHPLAETLRAFARLKQDGKVRHFGVSNFDAAGLERAVALAGPGAIACNQVLYHLGERAIEHAVAPACARHGVALVGYSPFGAGSFPPPDSPGGRVLAALACAHGASARQIALRFLLRLPGTFAIPKASRVEHVEDNAGADGLELTADDLARLHEAFPVGRPRALPTG